jgi:predicted Fe-Mo cluster-binding NifX family protein
MKIAIATTDALQIDQHFGRAETVSVLTVDELGEVTHSETRDGMRVCGCDGGGDSNVPDYVATLADCNYVLAKKIGPAVQRELASRGITAFELTGDIAQAVKKITEYENKQKLRRSKNEN